MPDSSPCVFRFLPAFLLLILLSVSGLAASPVAPYTSAELLQLCRQRQVWREPYWDLLLHRKRGLRGMRSLIDDPDFFLAADGKRDSRAELEATIEGLVAPFQDGVEPIFDRFPARCEWLVEILQLDRKRLPVPCCEEVEKVIASIDPQAAVFIFPNAFMNSPASMFGHTLLAIRGRDPDLLNQAVNYSAFSEETNGLLFAFKGIFGFYDGFYNITPYYQKIQEYNDINMRDIWEYELNLSRPEIERLMRHIWELHTISTRYFFFDENCSYTMMILLDLARPGHDLYRRTRAWVIPLDTLKLVQDAGFMDGRRYRPSRASQLRVLGRRLDRAGRRLALNLADGVIQPGEAVAGLATPAEQAAVLDVAATALQARRAKQDVDKKTYAKRFLSCLSARSRLDVETDAANVAVPTPASPDVGHDSLRLSVGRVWDDGNEATRLGLRLAYHDVMDPPAGYLDGAEIQFGNLCLRVEDDDRDVVLERFDLVSIRSLSPRDAFFKPVSWEVNVSVRRDWVAADEPQTFGELGLGGGWTWGLRKTGQVYVMPRTELRVGEFEASYSLGGGLTVGAWVHVGRAVQLGADVRALQFIAGDRYEDISANVHAGLGLSRNVSVLTEFGARTVDGRRRDYLMLSLRTYL